MSRVHAAAPNKVIVIIPSVIGSSRAANMVLGDVLVSSFQFANGSTDDCCGVVCIRHVNEDAHEVCVVGINHHSLHEKLFLAQLLIPGYIFRIDISDIISEGKRIWWVIDTILCVYVGAEES